MGAKQSKRSVDITNSPSKTAEGGEVIGEGEGRVVKIGDVDVKAATNGTVPHTEKDVEVAEKDNNEKDLTVEKIVENTEESVEIKESKEVKENGVSDSEELKTPESDSTADNLNESAVSEKTPESTTEGKEGEATAETKKQKEKKKKKWSFRSISFSKKDKSKPSKDAEKNGEVKEVAEENVEDVKSPTTESPKSEKPETPAEPAPVLNGDASKEEIAESPKPEPVFSEEVKKEVPKAEELKAEEPKVEESKVEAKVEESKITEPVESAKEEPNLPISPVEETKEVRNEEVPPPLPSSNPPSSLTAFAESTKAGILNTEINLLQVTTVVNPVLGKEIGEPLFEEKVDLKKEIANIPLPDSLPVSSAKFDIEPHLKSTEFPKSEPIPKSIDSEKSIDDLISSLREVPLKSEQTPELQRSDIKSDDKIIIDQSGNVIEEPSSETSLQESEKSEPKVAETQQNFQPLVQEILSVISSAPSENSDPTVADDPLLEPSTIELTLEPLTPVESDEPKDLQNKTDLEITQAQTECEPEAVEVKEISETLTLDSEENDQETKESQVNSQSSLPSNFIQTSVESNKQAEQTSGPQLKSVELIIEDAKPQNIEQLQSEQSLNYSEESESIDLPPSQESDKRQTDESKSDLPSTPPAPITTDECPVELPSPTDLPPPTATLVDPADSLQDISTESLPSLPEPVSENLAEPMSLPPVDSVPEPIATDCLPPESTPITTDTIKTEPVSLPAEAAPLATESLTSIAEPPKDSSLASDSNPVSPTECPPVLTNGSVNGLPSLGEVSPTTNGGSILLGEAAPLKQVPQEVPNEFVKEDEEKPISATTEVATVEE